MPYFRNNWCLRRHTQFIGDGDEGLIDDKIAFYVRMDGDNYYAKVLMNDFMDDPRLS